MLFRHRSTNDGGGGAERPTVIVTGSSGLIGRETRRTLADRYQVVGLDVAPHEDDDRAGTWVECDLTDDGSVARALDRVAETHGPRIASVVHLAAHADFSGESSPLYEDLNVQGSRRLAEALTPFEVEQVVYSSSLLVMEPVEDEDERLDESSDTRAEWAYPRSKLDAEEALREACGSIPLVVLRIAGVYDDDCHSIPISQQILRIAEGGIESQVFPGDADHGQPFIHMADLMRCIERVIESRGDLDAHETFLIAEPDIVSTREVREIVGERLHGEAVPAHRIPKTVARMGAAVKGRLSSEERFIKPWMIDLADDHYPVEIGRARERLGWEPERRLRAVLPELADRFREDPAAFCRENGLPEPDLAPADLEGPGDDR